MKKLIAWLLFFCSILNAHDNDFIVIALGESCGVTGALEAFNLKKASYPFEWCITNFEPLYESLKNDFLDFTNGGYFKPYIDNRSPVNKYGVVLAHDFPIVPNGKDKNGNDIFKLDPNWPNLLPAVQAKYQRRFDRFYKACNSGKKIYFVRHLEITQETAARLSKLLTEKFPNLDFTLICVRNSPPDLGTWHVNKVKNYYVDTTAPWGDVGEWRRIFIDVGIVTPNKSYDREKEATIYRNNLCGNCSYCRDFFNR